MKEKKNRKKNQNYGKTAFMCKRRQFTHNSFWLILAPLLNRSSQLFFYYYLALCLFLCGSFPMHRDNTPHFPLALARIHNNIL